MIICLRLPGAVSSAYYYVNGGRWQNTGWTLKPNASFNGAAEGDVVTVALTLAPEYYVDKNGNVAWDALGDGATLSVSAMVDNTAPELKDVSVSLINNTMVVTASDNQYVAGAVLYNNSGSKVLAYAGAKQNIEPGETAEYVLDLSNVNGSKFLVQVVDYAMNVATYKVEMQIGEEQPLPSMIAFDLDENFWTSFEKDFTHDQITSYEASDKTFFAATIVDHIAFASTDEGELYVMDERDLSDTTLVAKMDVVLTDMAYNKADGKIYGVAGGDLVTVDKLTGEVNVVGEIPVSTNTLACDANGVFYCNQYGSGKIYSFELAGGALTEASLVADTGIESEYVQAMEIDPNTGLLYWNSYYTWSWQTYTFGSSYLYEIDPASGTYTQYNDLYDEMSCLIIPEKTSGGGWAAPTDEVSGIQISDSEVTVVKNGTIELTAIVQPWTVTDRSVTWASSDESVAAVDVNGVVTGVNVGTAIITASSVLDPSYTAVCTVNVVTVPVTLYGALQDEEGNPELFVWNMENDDTWEPYAELDNDIASIAWDWVSDGAELYQHDTNGIMYKVNVDTGEMIDLSGGPAAFGAAMQDMDFAFYASMVNETPQLFGIYGAYLLGPVDPMENSFTKGWNLSSYLSQYTGATKFVALAWGGIDTSGRDCMYALDDTGSIWILKYTNGSGSIGLSMIPTDLDLSFPMYDEQQNCSMIFDDDLNVLYLSYFTGETNEIYMLEFDVSSGFLSKKIGDVGADVWPAALFMAVPHDENDGSRSADRISRTIVEVESVELGTVQAEEVDLAAVKTVDIRASYTISRAAHISDAARALKISGIPETEELEPVTETEVVETAVNELESTDVAVDETETVDETEAIVDESEPTVDESEPAVNESEPVVDESEPVADETEPAGFLVPVGSLNAINIVSPQSGFKISTGEDTVAVIVTAKDTDGENVVSTNGVSTVTYDPDALTLISAAVKGDYTSKLLEDGSITFGYVNLEGIAAGEPVAELIFAVKDTSAETVTIFHKETNDTVPGYTEDMEIDYEHANTEVRNAKEATCTEEGYTGDVYCSDCGKLLAQGEVIPATGHKYVETITKPTTTSKGYTTHTCEKCGSSYVDQYVDALKPDKVDKPGKADNADQADSSHTGDTSNTVLWMTLMLVSAAGVTVLFVRRKKSFRA